MSIITKAPSIQIEVSVSKAAKPPPPPPQINTSHPDAFSISVKTLTKKILTFHVVPSTTIEKVKLLAYAIKGIIPDEQRLIYKRKPLEDDVVVQPGAKPIPATLKHYEITNVSRRVPVPQPGVPKSVESPISSRIGIQQSTNSSS